eukprot:SAG11_NODE_621_length_8169_cov_2.866914_16_plen_68_part_01
MAEVGVSGPCHEYGEDRCSDRYSKSQYRIATVPREYLYSTGYETVPDPRPVLARYSAKMYPQLAEIHF